jgi:hypothetical protein
MRSTVAYPLGLAAFGPVGWTKLQLEPSIQFSKGGYSCNVLLRHCLPLINKLCLPYMMRISDASPSPDRDIRRAQNRVHTRSTFKSASSDVTSILGAAPTFHGVHDVSDSWDSWDIQITHGCFEKLKQGQAPGISGYSKRLHFAMAFGHNAAVHQGHLQVRPHKGHMQSFDQHA